MNKTALYEQSDHQAFKTLAVLRLAGGVLFVFVVVLSFLIAIFI